jgi:hypothetical protein
MVIESGEEYNFAFQMPKRKGDPNITYVFPSSLQMGWKNSLAYFCVAMQTTRELIKRMLALTIHHTRIKEPHKHKKYCIPNPSPSPAPPWRTPEDISVLSCISVDDFCNGVVSPVRCTVKDEELRWIARANFHGIHGVFPGPGTLQHHNGKDSISERELEKGDTRWKPSEVLLRVLVSRGPGDQRCMSNPPDKHKQYRANITAALEAPRGVIGFSGFQKLHSQIQYVSAIIPCIRFLMTPLN